MTWAEIVGPSAHDGTRLYVPDDTDAIVMITTSPGGDVHATLSRHRGSSLSNDDLATALLNVALNIPDGER